MQITKIADLKTDKVSALIYSAPGNGKTSMLGELKGKTLIIDVDRGTSVLAGQTADISVVRLDEELNDLFKVIANLEKSCPFDNVCIDSLSELEKSMLTVYGREGKNDGAPELAHYNRTQFKIADLCRRFRALDCNVIFTAWETTSDHIHPSGEKYTQAKPMLSGKCADTICGLCDIVGRLEISTKDDSAGKRYIRLEASPVVVAKDRIYKRKFCKTNELIGG
jgi:phage nucleotide-binding protein